ncbi:LysR family transcriptional regulator [Sporolactobacillus terrae]|uniref:LysR family transcriptional regulator n=1 Tax=Sporolactobacillus terrae TaxID=269673 RepID=UPI000491D277|nr:LysR family transcriptional regulator [Sporolactobacillus terrae]
MELNDLRIFVEVYQCGSFSKAADKLGYVQPNISNRIKKIEAQLGIRLFERTNKGIALLQPADQMYAHSKKILIDYHNMVEDLSKYKTLRVGATPTLAYSIIPPFTQRLKKSGYRNVSNSTHSISELFKQLDQNELDCIWINREFSNKMYKSV